MASGDSGDSPSKAAMGGGGGGDVYIGDVRVVGQQFIVQGKWR